MAETVGDGCQRLFFALWPEPGLQERLHRLGGAAVRKGDGRRVAAEKLHLTLCFLGGVDGGTRRCLEGQAGTVQAPPFTLVLDRLGYFPRPRVVWLGASAVPEPLPSLVQQLRDGQRRCGLEPERRPFQAHLTLARKARRGPAVNEMEPLVWPVERFALVASRTLPEGAQYEVLREWPLVAD